LIEADQNNIDDENEDEPMQHLSQNHGTDDDRAERTFNSEDDSTDIIPPSSNAVIKQRLFSDDEVAILNRLCKYVIESGIISAKRITDALNFTFPGKDILKKFKMSQITSQIKYERLKIKI